LKDSLSIYSEELHTPGFGKLFTIDCRGVEPVGVILVKGMLWAKAASGCMFQEIEFPEWYDYDEVNQASVSVTEVKFRITATKH